eukprot:SAG31_NODE_4814_length_2942_cov_2.731759_1_plen_187_part_00
MAAATMSDALGKFLALEALQPYQLGDVAQKKQRTRLWSEWDYNGNGYLSLAEIDLHLRSDLEKKYPTDQEGRKIWRLFRNSFIRAVRDASDADPKGSTAVAINGQTNQPLDRDEFVTKSEFRVLLSYLRMYAMMYEVYMFIDGGSAGRSKEDNAKLSAEEWEHALPQVRAAGAGYANFVSHDNDLC